MKKFVPLFFLLLCFVAFVVIDVIDRNEKKKYTNSKRDNYKKNTAFYISGNIFKMKKVGNFSYILFIKADSVNISKTAVIESSRISGIYDYNSRIVAFLSVSKSYDIEIKTKKIVEPLYIEVILNEGMYNIYFSHNNLSLTTEISDVDIKGNVGQFLLQQMDTMKKPIKF
ncbi:hypothetical protein [Capnocytophaga catalasegens]|nr:hypothetical protein [Capnocytophaga catalasegens]GIZ16117.1 hypothetical protein RCZ03_21170 [Capnocytophaga catalasegens]